jgi:hypothetical protein
MPQESFSSLQVAMELAPLLEKTFKPFETCFVSRNANSVCLEGVLDGFYYDNSKLQKEEGQGVAGSYICIE